MLDNPLIFVAWFLTLTTGSVLLVGAVRAWNAKRREQRRLRNRFDPNQRALAAKLALNAAYGKEIQRMAVKTQRVVIAITVAQLTERSFLAVSDLGGMNIRGQRRDNALAAVQSILSGLCGHDSSNAEGVLGLDLAIEGTDLQALAQLGDGSTDGAGERA